MGVSITNRLLSRFGGFLTRHSVFVSMSNAGEQGMLPEAIK
jgi:hypothetical protein